MCFLTITALPRCMYSTCTYSIVLRVIAFCHVTSRPNSPDQGEKATAHNGRGACSQWGQRLDCLVASHRSYMNCTDRHT